MFSYYGGKSSIIKHYPKPFHEKIIEPFAGSARYALEHFDHDVWLYDLSPYVIEVWRYLQQASVFEVMNLPNIESKKSLNDIKSLSWAERWLIGFHLCRGKAVPRHTGHGQNSWNRDKVRIAKQLYKIRHWKIFQLSYQSIPNMEATYFIDPPYEETQIKTNGDRYPFGDDINYPELGKWIQSRSGQVIACEGSKVDYIPVEPFGVFNANTNSESVKKSVEYIYLKG